MSTADDPLMTAEEVQALFKYKDRKSVYALGLKRAPLTRPGKSRGLVRFYRHEVEWIAGLRADPPPPHVGGSASRRRRAG